MDLTELSASALARAIGAREVSCRELRQATLARIALVNPVHNAIVSVRDGDELLCEADARDAELARGRSHEGRRGWMHGLPQGYLPMEAGILDVCEQALERLQGLGCAIEPTALGQSPSGRPGWCSGAGSSHRASRPSCRSPPTAR